MNRQQAKDLLPIIQAFAEGKTIESKSIAVVEIISTVGILLDAKELVAMMECFKGILLKKVRRELLKSAKEGKIIIPDTISFALMLKEFMGKD